MKNRILFMLVFWCVHYLIWLSEKVGYATAETSKKNADYYANTDKKWYHKFF
jgi:beta-galactosidase beta subunit